MSWSDSEPDTWNTPAITRDGFSFKDDKFYVAIGYHTHTRKDTAELYALLTYTPPPPALTKAGKVAKRQPKDTHKDEEAHFYAAQLIHYGLKPLKTREPAKKRLLAAFGVPEAVLELEVALRQEWKELDAKMEERRELIRAEEREQMAKYREVAEKERAAMILQKENEKNAETAGQANAPAAKTSWERGHEGTKKTATQKTSAVPMHLDGSDDEPEIVAVNMKMTRAQMLEKISSLSESQAQGLLKKIFENLSAAEKLFQAEFTTIAKGKGPSAKSTTNGKKYGGETADPSEWIGEYHVTVPKLAENWDDAEGIKSLEVYPSSTSAHIWASFDFGIISGVMRSVGPPPNSPNQGIPFEWRGREAGEDVMTFSKSNRGILTFLDGGKITAEMSGDLCSKFSFAGALQQRAGKPIPRKSSIQQRKEVKAWKKEWRGINWTNYEVANKARWGGWGGEEENESPFESDTTTDEEMGDFQPDSEGFDEAF
ncbi:hypothetical protein M413DRAFT_20802 [Hebeloma cylindrosporum]|uniref:Uncharacterized protein n=1 Tax=Hebeloma cylindrosporum TaxID=76867 RepID=A0A0C2XB52_HEBCY|nr:hypothetical protein M413DRAFT_20802 [Hebeloma cylindrosporum h7]